MECFALRGFSVLLRSLLLHDATVLTAANLWGSIGRKRKMWLMRGARVDIAAFRTASDTFPSACVSLVAFEI
jgi:hypothetical protein